MQWAAGLVGEQHRRVRELRAHIGQEPAQQNVQPVQHRHPPRPGTGHVGGLAELHVQLAERPTPEMHVRNLQQRRLFRPQASVIQGPEHRVVPRGRTVLAGGGDPRLQELEELAHPPGVGGAATAGESSPTCREALNSSTGHTSRAPNAASISAAFRVCRNRWNPLKICTYSRRVDAAARHRQLTDHPIDDPPGPPADAPAPPMSAPTANIVVDRHRLNPRAPRRHERTTHSR